MSPSLRLLRGSKVFDVVTFLFTGNFIGLLTLLRSGGKPKVKPPDVGTSTPSPKLTAGGFRAEPEAPSVLLDGVVVVFSPTAW